MFQEVEVTTRSPNISPAEGAALASGQPLRRTSRPRLHWLRALPLLARPITRTMPWVTLITGCVAGTVFLAAVAHAAGTSHSLLGEGTVRLALLPAVVALAFILRMPFRPLTQTTPVPAWVTPAGHLVVAAPILVLTCWAQLRIMSHVGPPHTPPAVYPVIAQFAGWSAVSVAAAAWVDRSRYADLGGAIAAPASLAAIALGWYAPITARFLTQPPATPHALTIAWYAVATAALASTCVAMRDRWHRYARTLHRECS
jgi:hypothetical protein